MTVWCQVCLEGLEQGLLLVEGVSNESEFGGGVEGLVWIMVAYMSIL